jgi:hypothetical protein
MTTPSPVAVDATELLRFALEILDDVARLLIALSPLEIQAVAMRKSPDAAGYQHALWKAYETRHRAFREAFERQRSLFATHARSYFACVDEEHSEGGDDLQPPSSH